MSDNVTSLGPRTLGATIPLPPTFLKAAEALGIPLPRWETEQKAFSFHRRKWDGKWGVAIFLRIGRLTLNLSVKQGTPEPIAPFPPTLAEARAWAVSFARQHGFPAMEDVREKRAKRPTPPSLTVVPGGKP